MKRIVGQIPHYLIIETLGGLYISHMECLQTCTTGDSLFAEGLRPSAKALPRAALGKELSGNFESAKRVFAEGPLSGTRQSLCRGLERHSAKKSSRHGAGAWDGVFAEGRLRGPSAKNYSFFLKNLCRGPPTMALGKEMCRIFPKNLCRGQWDGPRQRIILFFEKSLPRASTQALGKEILFFLKKSLCRGPPTMALGKEMLQKFYFFKKKIFAEGNGTALGKGPFFAEGLGHYPRQRGRNLIFFVFCISSIQAFHIYTYIYINHNT